MLGAVMILTVNQMREITKECLTAQVTAIVTWVLIVHRPPISCVFAGFINRGFSQRRLLFIVRIASITYLVSMHK